MISKRGFSKPPLPFCHPTPPLSLRVPMQSGHGNPNPQGRTDIVMSYSSCLQQTDVLDAFSGRMYQRRRVILFTTSLSRGEKRMYLVLRMNHPNSNNMIYLHSYPIYTSLLTFIRFRLLRRYISSQRQSPFVIHMRECLIDTSPTKGLQSVPERGNNWKSGKLN
jgi:hypothetical protein